MRSKKPEIIAIILLGAMMTLMALAWPHKYAEQALGGVAAIFLIHLVFSAWRHKDKKPRLSRQQGLKKTFLFPTTSYLNWDKLTGRLDSAITGQLSELSTSGSQTSDHIKPQLDTILTRLQKLDQNHPQNPGPAAAQGWAYSLLGQVSARETLHHEGCSAPGAKFKAQAEAMYTRAIHLAPDDSHIPADWGRALEERAALFKDIHGDEADFCLKRALEQYERSLSLDPQLTPAQRGRSRVLCQLATKASPDRLRLSQALEAYEKILATTPQDGAFYQEFGLMVSTLAQGHPDELGAQYYQRAGHLFLRAAEMGHQSAETSLSAGRAFQQAAELITNQVTATELHLQALEYFRQSATLIMTPESIRLRLWTASSLMALFQLPGQPLEGRTELLEEAETMYAAAAAQSAEEEVWSDWANLLSVMAENSDEKAGQLWAQTAEKYKTAAGCSNVPPNRAAVNWHNWAYALSCLAEARVPGYRRLELLKQAAQRYERAASLNGANLVTLVNWGEVLGQASTFGRTVEESTELYQAAEDKFKWAVRLYPNKASPWRRWSALLQEQARNEDNPDRRQTLWQTALEKLEQGARAKPDDPLTWVIWGRLLSELSQERPKQERPLLAAGAIEKHEKALNLAPGDDQTWSFLGRARLDATEFSDEKNPQVNLIQLKQVRLAAENFQTACKLNAKDDEHWAEWGRALFKLAQLMDNQASGQAALKAAEEKYLTASRLKPEESEHHIGLSHILYQWGWQQENAEAQRSKFQKSYDHCANAANLAPHNPRVWRTWAKVAEALANLEKDPRISFNWQNEADEKDYYADTLETPSGRSHHH